MNRERLDFWCERIILGLVLAILIFGPLATGAVRTLEFLIIQGLTVLAGVVWLIRLWLQPRAVLLWPPVCWVVLAFAAYAVVQYFIADVEYLARQELIRVLIYALLFLIVVNNLSRQETTQIMVFGLIFLAMAIAGYAIVQFATGSPKVWHFTKPEQYFGRAGGTYINPNHLAGFLEMILPLALAYALSSRLNHPLRIVLAYSCVVLLAGIGVTISRAGWIVAAVVVTVFFAGMLLQRGRRLSAVAMLLILLGVGAMFVTKTAMAKKRFAEWTKVDSADYRFQFWEAAWKMWKDNPLLGVGPGHFDVRFAEYRPAVAQARPIYVHNDYLNTLADWGAVGAILIGAACFLIGQGVVRTWPRVQRSTDDLNPRSSNRAAFLAGASLGAAAILLHSLADFNMQVPANAITALTLLALLTGWQRFASERFWRTPGPFLKLAITLVAGAALLFLSERGMQKYAEFRWLAHAEAAKDEPRERIAFLKKAHAVEPQNPATVYEIGELLRQQSWQGESDYEDLAQEAIGWFEKGIRLNPLDPYNYLRIGMCLDWLGRHEKAGPYFEQALQRDPNNYFIVAFQGWHQMHLKNYLLARSWFMRSLKLYTNHKDRNRMPAVYLEIIKQKLAEEKIAVPDGFK